MGEQSKTPARFKKGLTNLFAIVRRLLRVRELQGRLVGRRLVPVHVSHQLGARGTVDDQIGYLRAGTAAHWGKMGNE